MIEPALKDKKIIKSSQTIGSVIKRDFRRNKNLYFMVLPVIAFYIIFHYGPMYGALIAFKDYRPAKGIIGSDWVGFKHFIVFFQNHYFTRILCNTIIINIYSLIFGFPAPIILALMLNEIRNKFFKSCVQTISYLPHFISLVVVCGIIADFTGRSGIITQIVAVFGGDHSPLLQKPELFRAIYVSSDIWQQIGWNTIIYLASLTGIDPTTYEAATIDGAGRWRKMIDITIPGILPTIVILFIMRMGNIMNVGFEKIILLYNPLTYETADVISSYVYRKGILESSWSFSSAVGLFNSGINFFFLITSNWISKRLNETSLW